MHLLGHNLPDHKPLKIALLTFYGLSHPLASRLLSRLQIHQSALVSDLTEPQLTSLSAYLSSPSTTPKPSDNPIVLAAPGSNGAGAGTQSKSAIAKGKEREDPLDDLRIETEARRAMQADILHLRQVGSYRGRRHAAGYPVRGQRTQTNASTAGKLNRVERRGYASFSFASSTSTTPAIQPPSHSVILSLLARQRQ
ncbi:hypothetical protein CI109_101572 [Kwoniella shandongensis]|uniref:Small ribosomal subunit protein uS13m n=1 Tax=Kwoniella shandongensis TaxID=1734106 RepID=A0A5M6C9K9_9TREE|nr:uncharacterized protein CI109_001296 [Kwoniella shandongensis]KAA5530492.1 hypothetical protein CI109_001296 [Kwoniella shandongensis]